MISRLPLLPKRRLSYYLVCQFKGIISITLRENKQILSPYLILLLVQIESAAGSSPDVDHGSFSLTESPWSLRYHFTETNQDLNPLSYLQDFLLHSISGLLIIAAFVSLSTWLSRSC